MSFAGKKFESKLHKFPFIKPICFSEYFHISPDLLLFRCVSMSGSRTRFSKCSMSVSPYFVDVEVIQIEKTELSGALFFFYMIKILLNIVLNNANTRQFMQ